MHLMAENDPGAAIEQGYPPLSRLQYSNPTVYNILNVVVNCGNKLSDPLTIKAVTLSVWYRVLKYQKNST
jgi:hypothetical protein